jgi:predicted Zn-ribbon and HTH transcriptional regulator
MPKKVVSYVKCLACGYATKSKVYVDNFNVCPKCETKGKMIKQNYPTEE